MKKSHGPKPSANPPEDCYDIGQKDDTKSKLENIDKEESELIDVRNLTLIDRNKAHMVEDFQGERYSLVYYVPKHTFRTTAETAAEVTAYGFVMPNEKTKKESRI